ncbi:MAG: PBP1A family penicillin-binding protein [Candidatus Paralactobacillus gallistercoris]|uniref:PBP1A family penicillin-binding protein n=1 Tax=Candidatus Paralactobacillus gallistercoris TaxID=2838724 RepID=A0A948X1B3_9LACO|nr:PBP1A family penicillin-binding protein [Candidatus Paralactobacillus gallistercoris]
MNNSSRMARRQHKPHRWQWLKIILGIFLALLLGGSGLFLYYIKDTPKLTTSKLQAGGASTIYDSTGQVITTLGTGNQIYAHESDIPDTLKNAIISVEDRHFYQEKLGIDPVRIVKAAFSDITGSGNLGLQGGSTLTQQLVKLSFFSTKESDRTLKRKAQEAWLAMQVSRKYSKAQILEFYINKVYMGNGTYGMLSAAEYYFGKPLKQLTLPQLALLAGMPQSPNGYDPYTNPVQAKQRRNTVLNAMYKNNKITAQQLATAQATPINDGLVPQTKQRNNTMQSKIADNYVKEVITEVKDKMNLNPYTAGLKIYTNLNMKLQKQLYNIVNTNEYVAFPDDKLQTAVTMINPNNGKIMAQIGGRKTGDVQLGYNRAVATNRSNGSSMKPIMDYGPAIQYDKWSTYTQLEDTPYTYPGTSTQLYDWDHKYLGKMTMRKALVESRNVPAIRTLQKVGLNRAVNFVKGLGINLPKNEQVLSTGIGANVSTLQTAAAYAAFANGGTYYKPYYINKLVLADGTTYKYNSDGHKAMSAATAYMITDMLKGVPKADIGKAANIPGLYQAGKSGSVAYSQSEIAQNPALANLCKDAWYTGYTRHAVISVWTGYDQPLSGGLSIAQESISQEIYKALMTYYAQSVPNTNWHMPASVVAENILNNSPMPGVIAPANANANSYTRQLYVLGTQPHGQATNRDIKNSNIVASTSSMFSDSSTSSSSNSSLSSSSSASSSSLSSSSSASEPSVSHTTSSSASSSTSSSNISNNKVTPPPNKAAAQSSSH